MHLIWMYLFSSVLYIRSSDGHITATVPPVYLHDFLAKPINNINCALVV